MTGHHPTRTVESAAPPRGARPGERRPGKRLSWAAIPLDVIVCLGALIVAAVVVLLVLSGQWGPAL